MTQSDGDGCGGASSDTAPECAGPGAVGGVLSGRVAVRAAVLGVAVLLGSAGTAGAGSAAGWEGAVERYVDRELEELGVPGAAVAVVVGDEVAFSRGFGVTGPGGARVTPDTPFHIASLSKSLTALAVMRSVEAGDVDLDATIGDVLPHLEPAPAMADVTIRALLGHRSGLSTGAGGWIDPDESEGSLARNADRITALHVRSPGFDYSNANYDLLGHVVATVAGTSYETVMERDVFAPLGMEHTHTSEPDARADGLARGHYPWFGVMRPRSVAFLDGRLPSGQIMASASDLSRWVLANLQDGAIDGVQVLSPAGIDLMHTPVGGDAACCGYGMGFYVSHLDTEGEPLMLEHTGSAPAYSAGLVVVPDADVGVVVLLNGNDETAQSRYAQMHLDVARIVLGDEPGPVEVTEDLLTRGSKVVALAFLAVAAVRVVLGVRRQRSGAAGTVWRQTWPALLDLAVVAAVWWALLSVSDVTPAALERTTPDLYWAFVAGTALLLGWFVVRAVLALVRASRDR